MRSTEEVKRDGQNDGNQEAAGYTFCVGCNKVPFCGIRFYHKGSSITRMEPWPGFSATPTRLARFSRCGDISSGPL